MYSKFVVKKVKYDRKIKLNQILNLFLKIEVFQVGYFFFQIYINLFSKFYWYL